MRVTEPTKRDGLIKMNHQTRTPTNMPKAEVETKLLLEVDQEPKVAKTTPNNIQDPRPATRLAVLQHKDMVANNNRSPLLVVKVHLNQT